MSYKSSQDKLKEGYPFTTRQQRAKAGGRGVAKATKRLARMKRVKAR